MKSFAATGGSVRLPSPLFPFPSVCVPDLAPSDGLLLGCVDCYQRRQRLSSTPYAQSDATASVFCAALQRLSSQRCMFERCASKHTHSRGEQHLSVGLTRRRSILRPATWAALQCMRGWDVILSLVSGRVVSVRPDLSSQTCNTVPVWSSCPNGCPNLLSSAPSTTSQCPISSTSSAHT